MIGIIEPVRGVLLPEIRADLNLTYSAVGVLIFVSYWGFLCGSIVSGFASGRYGDKALAFVGALLIVVSTAVIVPVRQYLVLIGVMTVLRAGTGALDIAISAHGGHIFKTNAAVKMSLLHFCFGVGATVAPLYASFLFVRGYGWRLVYGFLAVPAVLMLCVLWMAPYARERHPVVPWRETFRLLIREQRIILLMVLMGTAIIFEATLLEWGKNYLLERRAFTTERANLYLTIFYGGVAVGRLMNGFVAERLGYLRTYLWYSLIIMVLFVLFVLFSDLHFLFLVVGWFVGPFFPIVMVLASQYFPHLTGGAMGMILAAGGLIQAGFGLLVGIMHDLLGVQWGFAFIGVGMVLAIPAVLLLMRENTRTT